MKQNREGSNCSPVVLDVHSTCKSGPDTSRNTSPSICSQCIHHSTDLNTGFAIAQQAVSSVASSTQHLHKCPFLAWSREQICHSHLTLSVAWMVHRIRVEAFKLIRREQDAPLVTLNLGKEVLLLIIMSWCHIPYIERKDSNEDTLMYRYERQNQVIFYAKDNKYTLTYSEN